MNWQHMLQKQLGSMGHRVGPDNLSPLVDTRGKSPKAPTILRYFLNLKIANT